MILRTPMLFGVKQSPALRGTALSQEHAPRRVVASLELEHYPFMNPKSPLLRILAAALVVQKSQKLYSCLNCLGLLLCGGNGCGVIAGLCAVITKLGVISTFDY